MRYLVRNQSSGDHLPHREGIANIHGGIEVAGFNFKAETTMRTYLVHPSFLKAIGVAYKHVTYPAFRAFGSNYRLDLGSTTHWCHDEELGMSVQKT